MGDGQGKNGEGGRGRARGGGGGGWEEGKRVTGRDMSWTENGQGKGGE